MMTRAIVGGLALVLCAGFSSVAIAAEEQGSTLAGQVADAANKPIAGADVVLLSADGQEIARRVTDATGTYSFGCIPTGNYQMELVPNNGFGGQRVAAPVGANGMAVAWVVDNQNPTIVSAAATGGACELAPVVADAGAGEAAAAAEGAAAAEASATASAATGSADAAGTAASATTVADAAGTGATAGGSAASTGAAGGAAASGGLSTGALVAGGGVLIAGGIAGVAIAAGTGAFSSGPASPAQ